MKIIKKIFRGLTYTFFFITDVLLLMLVWFLCFVALHVPKPLHTDVLKLQRETMGADFYTINNNWLKKSETGLWEIYVEGDGFDRGVIEGKLHKELAEQQEQAFTDQIKKMIPSKWMLNYLKFFIVFFNRNLDENIPDEYKLEIYGESLSASDKFDYIGPKYYRMLNYHSAHDIGHALQDKNMTVGCTAFGAWNSHTADSTILVGRNFDFYVGDAFAENKLINFVKPTTGYKFMMVSWAGMIGAVSGMNEKGLTVTINAAKSEIPTSSATPISILAREILQYAGTIDEALAIANKRKTFVSESILIGSKADNRVATIEKTPSKTALFNSPESDYIICANHYQGAAFADDKINQENIEKSSSMYRFNHLQQLLQAQPALSVKDAASILRNTKGMDEKDIGLGNEKSLNQLIAHHSVIFKPSLLQVWVSTNPYQLGPFICYDLNKVFAIASGLHEKKEIYEKDLSVPADSFLFSEAYSNFKSYKILREAFQQAHKKKSDFTADPVTISNFITYNPEYFETYFTLGNYYSDKNKNDEALVNYTLALGKVITTKQDSMAIVNAISKLKLKENK